MVFGKQPQEYFNKKRIAEITKLTQRQVQFYTEQGVVTPEIDAGEGRGKTRLYSDRNLAQFLIIKGLTELGMTISKIRPIIKHPDLEAIIQRPISHQGPPMYIKISRKDDGTLTLNWSSKDNAANQSVLNDAEIQDVDECIVINFNRISSAAYKR